MSKISIDRLNSSAYNTYGVSFGDLTPQQQQVIIEFIDK
jgi:hypothetical protein